MIKATPHHWSWSSAAVHSVAFYNAPVEHLFFHSSLCRSSTFSPSCNSTVNQWNQVPGPQSLFAPACQPVGDTNTCFVCIEDYRSKSVLLVTRDQVRGRSEVSSVASTIAHAQCRTKKFAAPVWLYKSCVQTMTSKRRSRTKVKRAAIQITSNNRIKVTFREQKN